MFRNRVSLYSIISLSLFFASCQKEDITGTSDYQTLGVSAHDLLTAAPYSQLQIEIHYMPGQAPDASVSAALVSFLNTYINKPSGIQVSQREIPASSKAVLTLNEIADIEKKYRSSFTAYHLIAVHILITDGSYQASDIFATSYWNTSFCLFGKTINESSGGPGQVSRTTLLTNIFEHEFGHLLGLVNQGSPMQKNHRDTDNGAHCDNTNCLMYFELETSGFNGNNIVPLLDNNCLADLKANGGK